MPGVCQGRAVADHSQSSVFHSRLSLQQISYIRNSLLALTFQTHKVFACDAMGTACPTVPKGLARYNIPQSDSCLFSALVSNQSRMVLRIVCAFPPHSCTLGGSVMGTREVKKAKQTRSHLTASAFGHVWRINAGRTSPKLFSSLCPPSVIHRPAMH